MVSDFVFKCVQQFFREGVLPSNLNGTLLVFVANKIKLALPSLVSATLTTLISRRK
ncbi:hypothetical protein Syun_001980 [Stephania yunnanensis]|uniref:Uncharacterized protein n=1 Tax=Stephania yunnanensis TaxID=152371 RepID=A0AAP0Q705_9MAGN